jgi:ribosomal protein L11 methyltransferase
VNWLEVSLTVNGELAEAVSEVLARYAPNGVMTEQTVNFTNDEDEGTPVGPISVRAYLPADDELEELRLKLEKALFFLGMIQPIPAPVYTPVEDKNWMEAWKEHYQPILVGKRLIIVPVWLDPPDEKRIPIKIDPGMAFGTGTHPTTQLCLELLEIFRPKAREVIDIGCGSGILSIGALKMGTQFALGVDIDEASVKASYENARINGIAEEKFTFGLGSVMEILAGTLQMPYRGSRLIKQAPLVLANILAPIIIRLFDLGLVTLVSPGGTLILSGILSEQSDSVMSAAKECGFRFVEKRQMEDWVALVLERPDI